MKKVAIWGASGHALVVADILSLMGTFHIVGFLDDVNRERWNTRFGSGVVLGGRDRLPELHNSGTTSLIVAIGDCSVRHQLAGVAFEHRFELVRAIHPRSVIAESSRIGAGTMVAAGAVVGPGAVLGDNVIVNTLASVDHECELNDASHVAPGAHLAGGVLVGSRTLVGIGASVREGVRIGEDSVIGAGAVVVNDIPDNVVAFGAPARVVKERRTGC